MGRKPRPAASKKIVISVRTLPDVRRALEKAAKEDRDTLSHVAELILIAALRERGFMK